jgi:perosamine synthetase
MNKRTRDKLRELPSLLVQLFKRRSLYQLNFTSGTTTWKECLMVLLSLLKLEPIQDGKWISVFEKRIAGLLGVKYAFSFSAGRMALYSILKAVDIGEGDEVIIQGYTCVVVPAAIIYADAKPVYVDISRKDYNIDVDKIEAKITDKTRAIIGQHTYGNPCDLEAIRKICDQHNLVLIEDCAHLLGTSYKGSKLGAMGDAAFFSTDHTKFISTSVGGIAVTNNEFIGQSLKRIYDSTPFLSKRDILRILFQFVIVNVLYHPRISSVGRLFFDAYAFLGLTFFMSNYEEIKKPDSYPFPARMSNIQAKIGISQINNLKSNTQHRNNITEMYNEILGASGNKSTSNALLRYPLEVRNREEWIKSLSSVLQVESWFDSCAQGKRHNLWEIKYEDGDCPIAEDVTKRIINLPTHLKVKPKDVHKIASRLNESLLNGIIQ